MVVSSLAMYYGFHRHPQAKNVLLPHLVDARQIKKTYHFQ